MLVVIQRSAHASEVIGKEQPTRGSLNAQNAIGLGKTLSRLAKALVGRLLKSNISNELTIYPSFARAKYFEYELRNPYSCEAVFAIQLPKHSELRVVTDRRMQEHYRRVLQPAA